MCSLSRRLELVLRVLSSPTGSELRRAPYVSSLVLFYGGSGLRDASGKQVRLDRDFLLRQQVDLDVEGLKSGKGDLDPMLPGAEEHPMSRAAEFTDGSGESVVHKNSGSLRCDL